MKMALRLLLCAALSPLACATAAPGELDRSFGKDGVVRTEFPERFASASGVAVQRDGKIVVVGEAAVEMKSHFALVRDGVRMLTSRSFCVARYLPDGGLDESFGDKGAMVTDAGKVTQPSQCVAVQRDGRIVVGGESSLQDEGSGVTLVRYLPDGRIDEGFGEGGKVRPRFVSGRDFYVDAGRVRCLGVQLQRDGRIVVAGSCEGTVSLARHEADGKLDASFGDQGVVQTPLVESGGSGPWLALQRDGKIVVTGQNERSEAMMVVRYDAAGRLDGSFGQGGKVAQSLAQRTYGWAMRIQDDGKIVAIGFGRRERKIAGRVEPEWGEFTVWTWLRGLVRRAPMETKSEYCRAVWRFEPDGRTDRTFGEMGVVRFPFSDRTTAWSAVAVQRDGKVLLLDTASSDGKRVATVTRLGADGKMDGSFGSGGVAKIGGQRLDFTGSGMAVQGDEKVLIVGGAQGEFMMEFGIIRLLLD